MISKKLHTAFALILAITGLHAQVHEQLSPLQVEIEKQDYTTRAADIYFYEVDTLALPIKDDFSTNKFRKYKAKPTDPNVTQLQFFHLMDLGGTPLPAGSSFSVTKTYRILRDTVNGDSLVELPSQVIKRDTLNEYPIIHLTDRTVWPCYNIIDSSLMVPGDIPDTVSLTSCSLYQDSVYVYIVSPIDQNTAIWLDHYAYHNYRYGWQPPTLGVVTFDGLNDKGYPYDFNTTTATICDFLTSKPIDLSGLTAADSVFLSFYYQPAGLGDAPEPGDSLAVEFLPSGGNPESNDDWSYVWSVPGSTLKPFRQVMLHIKDSQFLYSGFRFRFKNKGIPSGNIDIWNIDYVFLDRLRSKYDTIGGPSREDVAFQYQATTLLNGKYTSMPLTHFMTDPSGFVKDTIKVFKRNNDIGANIVGSRGVKVEREGGSALTYNLTGTIETAPTNSNYTTLYQLDTLGFIYDTSGIDSCAAVFHTKFYHNTTPDLCKENDTMYFSQFLSNYYAYDDGTAENAYGPVGEDGYDVLLAVKFNNVKADALAGVAIHFSPSVENNDLNTFNLTIWDNSGPGGAPGSIIYQETELYDVVYGNINNKFHVYPLSSPVSIPAGTFYVGWKQTEIEKINVGFDRNCVNNDRIWYNVGFGWTTSSFKGSLLVRPVFDACDTDVVGVEEKIPAQTVNEVLLYPNPAHQVVNINSKLPIEQVHVFDMAGQRLMSLSSSSVIQLDGLARGIYLVQVKTSAGPSVHRLVVE